MSFYDRALRKPLNSRWHLTMNLAVLGSWSLRKAKSSVHNCKASSQSLSAFAFFSSFAQPLSRVRLLTFFSMQWLCITPLLYICTTQGSLRAARLVHAVSFDQLASCRNICQMIWHSSKMKMQARSLTSELDVACVHILFAGNSILKMILHDEFSDHHNCTHRYGASACSELPQTCCNVHFRSPADIIESRFEHALYDSMHNYDDQLRPKVWLFPSFEKNDYTSLGLWSWNALCPGSNPRNYSKQTAFFFTNPLFDNIQLFALCFPHPGHGGAMGGTLV